MSQAPDFNIDYVANLARLALTPEEKEKFSRQLGDVLHHIEQLAKVDVTGVEPTAHAFPVENISAKESNLPPSTQLSDTDALRNAPAQRENMISVPKVVE